MLSCIGALIFLLIIVLSYFTVLYLSSVFDFLAIALPYMKIAIGIGIALVAVLVIVAIIKAITKK